MSGFPGGYHSHLNRSDPYTGTGKQKIIAGQHRVMFINASSYSTLTYIESFGGMGEASTPSGE